MKRVWLLTTKILTGLFVTAMYAMPQAYTVSAKPGGVNYIEGTVLLDQQLVSEKGLRSVFLNANDTLSTETGKAEILLTPGVFLRIGNDSQIRMISPSLVDTQVEVQRGAAMIEVDQLVKENRISVIDHGASISIEKTGLYRFTADPEPTAAVIEGKAQVYFGEKKVELGKGHETVLTDELQVRRFDTKKEDDLYAWSNIRSEYNASVSYQASRNVYNSGYSAFSAYGWNGFYGPGWYWDNGFSSWAWLPGNAAFFSPFGWGFYGPGVVAYAPVVVLPPGYFAGNHAAWWRAHHPGTTTGTTAAGTGQTLVPVNSKNPPALGSVASSPAAYQAARSQAVHSFAANGGFRTASGAPAPSFTSSAGATGGAHISSSGSHSYAGTASSSGSSFHSSGGSFSGGGVSHASASSGGGHSK